MYGIDFYALQPFFPHSLLHLPGVMDASRSAGVIRHFWSGGRVKSIILSGEPEKRKHPGLRISAGFEN